MYRSHLIIYIVSKLDVLCSNTDYVSKISKSKDLVNESLLLHHFAQLKMYHILEVTLILYRYDNSFCLYLIYAFAWVITGHGEADYNPLISD